MKKWLIFVSIFLCSVSTYAQKRYGEILCTQKGYVCLKIKSGDQWSTLFKNPEERDLVRRINRMNINLRPGMIIAKPENLDVVTIYDVSPFPRYIPAPGEKRIYVNQKDLAWGAYEADGELIWWGPISPGMPGCKGVTGGCETPSGSFRIIRKQDVDCISTAFPRRADGNNGGAAMPYCMHFFKGYALHGSNDVPGYAASHGCVRMFTEDARWLNEEFISTQDNSDYIDSYETSYAPQNNEPGTRVILGAP